MGKKRVTGKNVVIDREGLGTGFPAIRTHEVSKEETGWLDVADERGGYTKGGGELSARREGGLTMPDKTSHSVPTGERFLRTK